VAALNRFISRSTDKCFPFYTLLRKVSKGFIWNESCEEAFKQLKRYLSEPSVLAKREFGEQLFLYIAVSESAVTGVQVRVERSDKRPIFYVSKSFSDAETRYPMMEKLALAVVTAARKLRPYFQSHPIVVLTSLPLRTILHSPTQSGRLGKWAIELSEFDLEFRARTSLNSTMDTSRQWGFIKTWVRSRNLSDAPTGEVLEQSFRLAFNASNNEAEYESLLVGLRLAVGVGVRNLHAHYDSQQIDTLASMKQKMRVWKHT